MDEVDAGRRDEGGEAADELEGSEDELADAVGARALEPVGEAAVVTPGEAREAEVFAPAAKLRPHVVPRPGQPPLQPHAEVPASPKPPKKKSRLDWADLLRRGFSIDVLACPCGGRRTVLAFITEASTVRL